MEELRHFETNKFKSADSNGDGFLDATELAGLFYPETNAAVLAITVEETMKKKDKDADGKLTAEEFWEVDSFAEADAKAEELSEEEKADFAKLDTNNDNFLDLEELT